MVNEKDLEQVVAVREFGTKYLVSYDKHFESIEEYRTPKQFGVFRTANASSKLLISLLKHKTLVIDRVNISNCLGDKVWLLLVKSLGFRNRFP